MPENKEENSRRQKQHEVVMGQRQPVDKDHAIQIPHVLFFLPEKQKVKYQDDKHIKQGKYFRRRTVKEKKVIDR